MSSVVVVRSAALVSRCCGAMVLRCGGGGAVRFGWGAFFCVDLFSVFRSVRDRVSNRGMAVTDIAAGVA